MYVKGMKFIMEKKIYIEKEDTLVINEKTKLELLNIDDFVSYIKKESSFVPAGHIKVALKYKLSYDNYEYYGESTFDSYKGIKNNIDNASPYKVELVNFKLSDKEEKYLEFDFAKNDQVSTSFFELAERNIIYDEKFSFYNYKADENIEKIKLQLCYSICNNDKLELQSVELKSHDGEGKEWIPDTIEEKYEGSKFKEEFKDINSFYQKYGSYPYLTWRIKAKYLDTNISITSVFSYSSSSMNEICISCSTNANLDYLSLLCEIKNGLLK